MTATSQHFGKVAVLMGGQSAEREISFLSGRGVLAALQARGVDAHAFDPAERQLSDLQTEGFERCFIALHGRFGEDGTVQGALELLGIPYTGSGVMASSIAIDKTMTKRVWLSENVPTPRYVLLQKNDLGAKAQAHVLQSLGLPLIVKPAREGSSIGVTKVTQASELLKALEDAAQCDSDILCEQFIAGDEVTCPVLGEGETARALPVIRIVAPAGNYDYQNKYFTDDTQYLVPSGLPEAEEKAIQAHVVKAYQVLGCKGWGRVDVMIDAQTRKPYLLEINTSPLSGLSTPSKTSIIVVLPAPDGPTNATDAPEGTVRLMFEIAIVDLPGYASETFSTRIVGSNPSCVMSTESSTFSLNLELPSSSMRSSVGMAAPKLP
jgi:D-alanine-D-alanine ligase